MDERKIKRLLISLAVAIALIMVAKHYMLEAAATLGNAAAEKKRAAVVQTAPVSAPEAAAPVEIQPASEVAQSEVVAASAVEATQP